jgi:hypothetical protein
MTDRQKNEILLDALLKLAVAEAYGAEIDSLPDEEALAGHTPSPELDRRIGNLVRKYGRRAAAKRAFKTIGKAAACLCILLTVSAVVLLSVRATRNAIFNAVIEWTDKYTQFRFEEPAGQSSDPSEAHFRRPTYLPAGYTEKSSEIHEIIGTIVYENGAGGTIVLSMQKAATGTTAIDNERHDQSEIQLNGKKAYLFTARDQNDQNILFWESDGVAYTLLAPLDTGELVKIAESVK